jgi:hypothetical protein
LVSIWRRGCFAVDTKGEIVVARKLTRSQLIPFFAELPPCVVAMLGVFAEFETAIRRERQLEEIEAAKAKGVYRGASVD